MSLAAEIGQEKYLAKRAQLERDLQGVELVQVFECSKPRPQHPKHPKYPKHPKLPKQVWTIVSGIIRGVVHLLHLNGESVARTSQAQPHTPTTTKVSTSKPVTSGPVMPHTTPKSSINPKPTSSQSHAPIYPVPKPHSTTLVRHTYAAQP
ncbi:hypothetical protein AC578_7584 [Pseudocercospora eumusae]|uniref:Uncharacterized protein n=1 Tax=Pseudocercospora eumusae TaxID=321146 RepID=A0A139HRS7_9PEZI|nr:hypothetical protein AC578_7584 [Pseudocercospora eumusae]